MDGHGIRKIFATKLFDFQIGEQGGCAKDGDSEKNGLLMHGCWLVVVCEMNDMQ